MALQLMLSQKGAIYLPGGVDGRVNLGGLLKEDLSKNNE